jgi:hypothetical protein
MMDDHGLLRDLARTAREEEAEEQQRWDRWDRLNDGALSAEEEAELRSLAASSVEAERAFEAFRPLSPDFRARVVAEIGPLGVRADAAPAESASPVEAPYQEERPRKEREETSHGRLTFPWWPTGFGWRLGFLGSGPTAAAALFFILRLPPLPQFTITEVSPGVETTRSAETRAVPALMAGEAFSAVAHPAAKPSDRAKIEPRCYVLPSPPAERKLRTANCTAPARESTTGAFKIEGRLPPDLPSGSATLWIVIAYRGDHPASDFIEKLPANRPTQTRTWDAEPVPIEVQAP